MKILNHLLISEAGQQVPYRQTPNHGGALVPQYLIMHYTAALQASSSINWFTNPQAKASAHLLIDRDGSITQFAPFDVVTWHAGESRWGNLNGMNQYAIGIELVNAGKLMNNGNNWMSALEHKMVPHAEVIVAKHKNEQTENGWQNYTTRQLEVAQDIAILLTQHYGLKDVLGHEDIAPYRKSDPGPAFPMASFKAKVMGRESATLNRFVATDALNLRSAPSSGSTVIAVLPFNTATEVLKREGNWSFVMVEDVVNNTNDLEGWVFSKYLAKA